MSRKKVIVAMSGGVDSSVAAALLVKEGYEVIGVSLKLVPLAGCCGGSQDAQDARRVCEILGIPHHILNLEKLFESKVVSPFVESYLEGLTPNPCVECNRHIKFSHLLDLVSAWDVGCLATGHYARVGNTGQFYRLLKAKDKAKDQSYFLYMLSRKELGKVLFPVGGMTKPEVRAKARKLNLPTAEKPQSQDVCFIPGGNYRDFLAERLRDHARPGPIRDASGRVLGTHRGLCSYTVGQRRGLGVSTGKPLFVNRLDTSTNTLVVGPENETASSFCRVRCISWTRPMRDHKITASVKIRHRHKEAKAVLKISDDFQEASVSFLSPQKAVTPGQSAVFYKGEEVLGGGIIR